MWHRWRGLPERTVSVPPCLRRLQLAAVLCSNESGRLQEDSARCISCSLSGWTITPTAWPSCWLSACRPRRQTAKPSGLGGVFSRPFSRDRPAPNDLQPSGQLFPKPRAQVRFLPGAYTSLCWQHARTPNRAQRCCGIRRRIRSLTQLYPAAPARPLEPPASIRGSVNRPRAIPWRIALPNAVASTAPATTGKPVCREMSSRTRPTRQLLRRRPRTRRLARAGAAQQRRPRPRRQSTRRRPGDDAGVSRLLRGLRPSESRRPCVPGRGTSRRGRQTPGVGGASAARSRSSRADAPQSAPPHCSSNQKPVTVSSGI